MKTNSPKTKPAESISEASERGYSANAPKTFKDKTVDTLRGSKTEQNLEKEIERAKNKTNIKEIKMGDKFLGYQPEYPMEFAEEMENVMRAEAKLEGYKLAKKEIKDKIERELKGEFGEESNIFFRCKMCLSKVEGL